MKKKCSYLLIIWNNNSTSVITFHFKLTSVNITCESDNYKKIYIITSIA